MNRKQINKFRMYEAVNAVFDTHPDLVAQLDDLDLAQKKLKAAQQEIGLNRQVQEADNSGLTKSKTGLRIELENGILQLSSGLRVYATLVKNEVLKTKANYSVSDLKLSADPILYDIGILLMGLADPIRKEMAKYFIGDAEFAELSKLLADFKSAMPQRRVATSVSKVSTGNISAMFEAQDKLLKDEIDVLMILFRTKQPDFYKAYRNARSIIDYSARGKSEPHAEKTV